jgi:hypothetical protein
MLDICCIDSTIPTLILEVGVALRFDAWVKEYSHFLFNSRDILSGELACALCSCSSHGVWISFDAAHAGMFSGGL